MLVTAYAIVKGMLHVVVLCGGLSREREVSLRSGRAVAEALQAAGYEVQVLDTDCDDNQLKQCDVVFPVLHGVGGEDGKTQARLESLGIAFVGSDSKSSRLCMDKSLYRSTLQTKGLLMPQGDTMDYATYVRSELHTHPHVVKPVDGGSSVDTYIVRDMAVYDAEVPKRYFQTYGSMIVEELILGTEVTVGILGDKVLPIIEIIPPADQEFDYDNKYNGQTQELIPAIHVADKDQKAVQELALEVHKATGCRDFSRTDFIISEDGQYYLLETNTIPGMTAQSLFPKMALAIGMDMPALCDNLVKMALERKH